MIITETATDEAILTELGERFMRARLERNLTQEQLAAQAGVAKRTVERLENGETGTRIWGFIRVCRTLGLAGRLDMLAPEGTEPGPMARLRLRGRVRKRASGRRRHPPENFTYAINRDPPMMLLQEEAPAQRTWKWGDEK